MISPLCVFFYFWMVASAAIAERLLSPRSSLATKSYSKLPLHHYYQDTHVFSSTLPPLSQRLALILFTLLVSLGSLRCLLCSAAWKRVCKRADYIGSGEINKRRKMGEKNSRELEKQMGSAVVGVNLCCLNRTVVGYQDWGLTPYSAWLRPHPPAPHCPADTMSLLWILMTTQRTVKEESIDCPRQLLFVLTPSCSDVGLPCARMSHERIARDWWALWADRALLSQSHQSFRQGFLLTLQPSQTKAAMFCQKHLRPCLADLCIPIAKPCL